MSRNIIRYRQGGSQQHKPAVPYPNEEPMEESELAFLVAKRDKDRSSLVRTLRTLCIAFVILPFGAGAVLESIRRVNDAKRHLPVHEESFGSRYAFFIGILFLLFLISLAGYISYVRTLKRVITDIRRGLKTVEQTTISRKVYMTHNDTCHFYLRSSSRLSIEVSREDYEHYEEEDEINIEYSTYAKVYFGYY
ncbi:hypothetical protein [Taibaiella chishuiensis]|uniref:Uncharacterized protein n=1 Tax=Taibaiella chishuiensis TaxID=1434707 RepID=A0A2P8D801_9BACT|nr:hypothetical protein [Taibaiella chishuiensis]PSK93365.1 hypothetical protein B0I18_102335 [Taibaiella chishuiensis]